VRTSVLFLVVVGSLLVASADADELEVLASRSFYTHERIGELILVTDPDWLATSGAAAQVLLGDEVLVAGVFPEYDRRLTVPFPLVNLPQGDSRVTCRLLARGVELARATATVTRLPHRPNAVKIDRIGGGLIVDDLPFFPVGFYCYSPVQPGLPEEEVVRGFNTISPFQSNDPETLDERRAYMDRCAELGMKVHYQLLSVAGGGGVADGGEVGADADETGDQEDLLRKEVMAFRDHPALLAWYISDEPTGHNTPPQALERSYRTVRELDPYHPVTIVFMAPTRAHEYAGVMDVVMTDPYPIPHNPPASVADAVTAITQVFGPDKPVWLVPQAFGGNEDWTREPTAGEQRVMTFLGIVEGATGIQYFVRDGMNRFPKSPIMWAACSRAALEVAALTPVLLSREARPPVVSSSETVRAAAWRDRGEITVIAVNTENRPQAAKLVVEGVDLLSSPERGTEPPGFRQAEVLFEDRAVPVKAIRARREGLLSAVLRPAGQLARVVGSPSRGERPRVILEDIIDAYGVRMYRLTEAAMAAGGETLSPRNLMLDPSFEWESAPSTAAGMYAGRGGGRGATYFLDSRVAFHGRHSLRLHTPGLLQGVPLHPYSPSVTEGRAYRLSAWAKASPAAFAITEAALAAAASAPPPVDPLRAATLDSAQAAVLDSVRAAVLSSVLRHRTPVLHLAVGGTGAYLPLTSDWQEYHVDVVIPPGTVRTGVSLSLPTPGTAWVDLLQLVDISPLISARANPGGGFTVSIDNYLADTELRYTLDGSAPTTSSPLYAHPFQVDGAAPVRCSVFEDGEAHSTSEIALHRHAAVGRFADLLYPYSPRYPASGPAALTDGLLGGDHFRHNGWQGYEQDDLVADIDLGRELVVEQVGARFLQNMSSWIWLPTQVSFYASSDGEEYDLLGKVHGDAPEDQQGTFIEELTLGGLSTRARYLRVHAENVGRCPPWHGGVGGKAWLFVDEIIVNAE